jgi:uncharacterized membrane protein YoaT (DUF817 family)
VTVGQADPWIERALGDAIRARLAPVPAEWVLFVLKHLWAGAFGGVLIVAIAGTRAVWQDGWALARYDTLFGIALLTQVLFLTLRLETRHEGGVIAAFAALGLGMEVFKVGVGSWAYPEPGFLALAGVPLFVGFMYAAVGLCIVRMIRIFDMQFAPFPPLWLNTALAAAIYANFFVMHSAVDLRMVLMGLTLWAYGRCRISFRAFGGRRSMPMLVSLLASALGVWLVENLGTLTGTWLYAGQQPGQPVTLAALGSWYLFLCVALAMALALRPQAVQAKPVPVA